MTGIEELARTAGRELRDWGPPDPHRADGSPAATAARAVRRSRVRRAALSVAALALVGGMVTAQWPEDGDRVEIVPPAGHEERDRPRPGASSSTTTSTTAPGRTTATSAPGGGTGEGQGPGTTAGAPEASEPADPPPAPGVRDIDFGSATYPAPCPAYDGGAVTLAGGRASVPLGGGARLDVALGPVSYADADGDGDEDALVVVRCDFAGADADSGALLAAYRAGANGQPEALGAPQALEHVHDVSARGLTVTATVDVYGPNDPACCPSSGAEQTWAFGGGGFTLQSSRDIPPPGAG